MTRKSNEPAEGSGLAEAMEAGLALALATVFPGKGPAVKRSEIATSNERAVVFARLTKGQTTTPYAAVRASADDSNREWFGYVEVFVIGTDGDAASLVSVDLRTRKGLHDPERWREAAATVLDRAGRFFVGSGLCGSMAGR